MKSVGFGEESGNWLWFEISPGYFGAKGRQGPEGCIERRIVLAHVFGHGLVLRKLVGQSFAPRVARGIWRFVWHGLEAIDL